MASKNPLCDALVDRLYRALETEQGGIEMSRSAIARAVNDELRKTWRGYLDETCNRQRIGLEMFSQLGLVPEAGPAWRDIVGGIGGQLPLSRTVCPFWISGASHLLPRRAGPPAVGRA